MQTALRVAACAGVDPTLAIVAGCLVVVSAITACVWRITGLLAKRSADVREMIALDRQVRAAGSPQERRAVLVFQAVLAAVRRGDVKQAARLYDHLIVESRGDQ